MTMLALILLEKSSFEGISNLVGTFWLTLQSRYGSLTVKIRFKGEIRDF